VVSVDDERPAFVALAVAALVALEDAMDPIVVGRSAGGELRGLRQRLGREITRLEELAVIPDLGVLVTVDG
jgi:hypothetical protein